MNKEQQNINTDPQKFKLVLIFSIIASALWLCAFVFGVIGRRVTGVVASALLLTICILTFIAWLKSKKECHSQGICRPLLMAGIIGTINLALAILLTVGAYHNNLGTWSQVDVPLAALFGLTVGFGMEVIIVATIVTLVHYFRIKNINPIHSAIFVADEQKQDTISSS